MPGVGLVGITAGEKIGRLWQLYSVSYACLRGVAEFLGGLHWSNQLAISSSGENTCQIWEIWYQIRVAVQLRISRHHLQSVIAIDCEQSLSFPSPLEVTGKCYRETSRRKRGRREEEKERDFSCLSPFSPRFFPLFAEYIRVPREEDFRNKNRLLVHLNRKSI